MKGSVATSVALAFIAAVMLTGCTAGIEGFIGLERKGDSFRAVVSMCDGSHITKVELRDRSLVNSQRVVSA